MFFPSISWPSVDKEADVQSSSSLPFSGVVLLSGWPHAVCWLSFHSPLYFSGCGSWLPAPINRQVTVCWGSILYNLTPFVVSGGGHPWRSLRKYQFKMLMIVVLITLRMDICSSTLTSSGSVINKCVVTDSWPSWFASILLVVCLKFSASKYIHFLFSSWKLWCFLPVWNFNLYTFLFI